MPYKPDVARLSTIHSPPNSCTRNTWCLISLASWGSCDGYMRHLASCLVCPLDCSLYHPVALYKFHVMSYSQLFCFPSGLSSPLSSCLVQGACYIIQPVDLFHSSVQHCAPINVKLSKSTTLVADSCYRTRGIHFQWTFTFECTFYNKRNWIITTLHATNVFNICCVTFKNSHFYRPQKLLSFLDHSFMLFQGPLCWKGHYKKFWVFWPKPWLKPFGKYPTFGHSNIHIFIVSKASFLSRP